MCLICIQLGEVFPSATGILGGTHCVTVVFTCIRLGEVFLAATDVFVFSENRVPLLLMTCIRLGEVFLAATDVFLQHEWRSWIFLTFTVLGQVWNPFLIQWPPEPRPQYGEPHTKKHMIYETYNLTNLDGAASISPGRGWYESTRHFEASLALTLRM